jgi:hypothetical protein
MIAGTTWGSLPAIESIGSGLLAAGPLERGVAAISDFSMQVGYNYWGKDKPLWPSILDANFGNSIATGFYPGANLFGLFSKATLSSTAKYSFGNGWELGKFNDILASGISEVITGGTFGKVDGFIGLRSTNLKNSINLSKSRVLEMKTPISGIKNSINYFSINQEIYYNQYLPSLMINFNNFTKYPSALGGDYLDSYYSTNLFND